MVVIGVDLGTQSLKAVVCDDQLRVLGARAIAHPTRTPRPGWAEQDPRAWEAALEPAIAGALADANVPPTDVAAIAFAGQLDGCVAVDGSGLPVHAALIWHDKRAVDFVQPTELARTGQVADPSHMAPKIAWLEANHVRAARFHQPVSYLVERLTGAAVLDPAHASTTLLYDLAAKAWAPTLLAAYRIDDGKLPAIAPASSIAGALRTPLAGIPAGVPVAVGTGDDFATPLGAGIASPGRIACALGTAEVVGAVSEQAVFDPAPEPMVETHAYPTGAFFVENPGWMSGGAVRWATRLLGLHTDAELDALAASIPDTEVTFIPALAGAMTPVWRPNARGALHGLAASHGPADVARAVLEGLAFACKDVVDRLDAMSLAGDVVVLGGGSASAVWMQIRADVVRRTHHVSARADSCAVGAAMLAAVAIGTLPDLATAAALAPPPSATFSPRAPRDDAYARYRDLVSRLL